MSSLPTPVLLFFAALTILIASNYIKLLRGYRLPPGPRGLPIIGNALEFSKDTPLWLTFSKWAKEYGDIVHVSSMGSSTILLNSPTVINELLEKRSVIYSDRPPTIMADELCGWGQFTSSQQYGERLRTSRKMFNDVMSPRNVVQFHDFQESKSLELLSQVYARPMEWSDHLHLLVSAIAFKAPTGLDVTGLDDPLIATTERAMGEFGQALAPGAWLVDFFPFLKYVPEWFPGATFKKQARIWRESTMHVRDDAYAIVKANVTRGTANPSLLATFVQEHPHPDPELEDIHKHFAGSAYLAALDTTMVLLLWLLYTVSKHSEVQEKAQQEIDRVCDPGTLPGFKDAITLPYIRAIITEAMRLLPPGPFGVPHRVSKDDFYNGYFIPAGSTIIGNIWAVMHEPSLYPAPDNFIPERFLKDAGDGLNPDPRSYVFGFGRRVCPGRYLAEETIFITFSRLLAAYKIEQLPEGEGRPITANQHDNPFFYTPPAFDCKLTPRTIEMEKMLKNICPT